MVAAGCPRPVATVAALAGRGAGRVPRPRTGRSRSTARSTAPTEHALRPTPPTRTGRERSALLPAVRRRDRDEAALVADRGPDRIRGLRRAARPRQRRRHQPARVLLRHRSQAPPGTAGLPTAPRSPSAGTTASTDGRASRGSKRLNATTGTYTTILTTTDFVSGADWSPNGTADRVQRGSSSSTDQPEWDRPGSSSLRDRPETTTRPAGLRAGRRSPSSATATTRTKRSTS